MVTYEFAERGVIFISKMKRTNVYFSEEVHRILTKMSKENYCTISHIVRVAVTQYMSRKGWFRYENR